MKVLIISPTPTHPTTAGNRARIKALVSSIRMLGHDVHFAFVPMEDGDAAAMRSYFNSKFSILPYRLPKKRTSIINRCVRAIRRFRGDERAYIWGIDDWYDPRVTHAVGLLETQNTFDVVLVEYVFLSRVLEAFPDSTLKIIDTHDTFSNRHRKYLEAGKRPEWFSITIADERSALLRAHTVIAIQEGEGNFFKNILRSEREIVTVGHLADTANTPHFSEIPAAIFIGSANSINVDGINHFIRAVLPLVRSSCSDFSLILAGDVCEMAQDAEGVRKFGRVSEISEIYRLGSVGINPVRMGTGLNIKTIECLSLGVPLVVTETGSRGLENTEQEAFVVVADDDPRAMAAAIIDLLDKPQRRRELAQNALRLAQELNNLQVGKLENILRLWESTGSQHP
jgi:glycosyltransferase involved in cell wall biosynthesis